MSPLTVSTAATEPNLTQATQLCMFLHWGAHKPHNEIRRVNRSGCDTHKTLRQWHLNLPHKPPKARRAAVTYRWRDRTLAAAGPREGMVVSSLLSSRLQQTQISCWRKQPKTRHGGAGDGFSTSLSICLDSPGMLMSWHQGDCLHLRNGPTLSSKPNHLMKEKHHNWSHRILFTKIRLFIPPSTHFLKQSHQGRSLCHSNLSFHSHHGGKPEIGDCLHPWPSSGQWVELPLHKIAFTCPSMPGQDAVATQNGGLSPSPHTKQIPQGQSHKATNTHIKPTVGTAMPPNAGDPLQPGSTMQPPRG